MNLADHQYNMALRSLLTDGQFVKGRTAFGTYKLFGHQMRFNLQDGFPLITTKRLHLKSIIVELLWFLSGSTNIKYLKDHKVRIWDEWADKDGELGPVYGKQWRSWAAAPRYSEQANTIDQIANVIASIKTSPYGRRHIVTAWNPAEVDDMALPPCHCLFQFNVRPSTDLSEEDVESPTYLDCHLYQRSADWFLGVPFNIASYALLTHLIARECDLMPGEFIHTFGDYHIYENHIDLAREQLSRPPYPQTSRVVIKPNVPLFDLTPADITVEGYQSHDAIKAEVSV